MEISPLHIATDCEGLDPKDGLSQVLVPFKPRKQLASNELKQRLHARLQEALFHLFPAGKVIHHTFVIGNVQGHGGKSLTVELSGSKAGLWHDFATGEGGDIFTLWGTAHRWDHRTQFPQIITSIQEWLGISGLPLSQKPASKQSAAIGAPTAKWPYHDANGKIIACVYRYDTPDSKQFRPWDAKTHKYKAPDPRPLYNQPGIARSETVILVEGEKCADALINLGICATTAMNGANAIIDKTDWSPLLDKHVVIWPDHDAPGKTYAAKVIKRLQSLGLLSLTLLIIPEDKPSKWDAADAVAEGIDVRAFIEGCPREVIFLTKPKDTAKLIEQKERKSELTSGLLTIGSDFELGRRALQDLRQKYGQIIFTEGDFYRYHDTQWVVLTSQELHNEIEKYDGYFYVTPPKTDIKIIKLNCNKKNSAIHTMEQGASCKDFFKGAPLGVNCANGFIKFTFNEGTKKWQAILEEHKPEHRQRHTLAGRWQENAPTWVADSLHSKLLNGCFWEDTDKESEIQSMKELAGATISGCATKLLQPRALIFYGIQAENGKSQVLNMLRGLLPASAVSSVTAAKMGDERHILGICGKLLNASDELSGASAISSEIFKAVITGETVSGRDVYKSRIEFNPIAQHAFATNTLPSFQGGMDRGVQRRLLLILFNRVIPRHEKIENIGQRIAEEEMDLLLAWAVEGALELMNNRGFTMADALVKSLQDWLEECDSVQGWVAECIEILGDEEAYLKTSYAYKRYQEWAKEQGIKLEQIVGLKSFVQRMMSINGISYKRTNSTRVFMGINLTHDAPRSTVNLDFNEFT